MKKNVFILLENSGHLYEEPSLEDLVGVGEVLDPLHDLLPERRVVPGQQKVIESLPYPVNWVPSDVEVFRV